MFGGDNLFNTKTGGFESTTGSVTVDTATTAGNAVLICAGIGGDNGVANKGLATPSGFTAVSAIGDGAEYAKTYMWVKPSSAGGETSWTLNVNGGTEQVLWFACEITGADLEWVDKAYLNAGAANMSFPAGAAIASQASNVTASSESYSAVALAVSFVTNTTPTAPTITSWSDNFYEIANASVANGTRAHALSVAIRPTQVLGTMVTTASVSPNSYMSTWLVAFTGLDSKHAPNILTCFGAEIGTATGLTTGDQSGGPAPWDTVTGSPEIVTTHPRSGSYGLKFSSSAAAECVTWEQKTAPQIGTLGTVSATALPTLYAERFHIYFETSLPGADLPLASCEVGSLANGMIIWYRSASQKIGIQIGAGTEQLSNTTIVADKHIGIDYEYDPRTTTHLCNWAVDYDATPLDPTPGVAQTQASTASMTSGGISKIRKGWSDSRTGTVYMDDIFGSKTRKNYPIGDIQIVPVKVDPAGTISLVGSASLANYKTFTSNGGTLSTPTDSNVRSALDDVPAVVGASSDGLAQVTVDATGAIRVPMEEYVCAPDYSPVAGRWYTQGWAASGNPASIKYNPYDGTQLSRVGSDDPGFDDTNVVWLTGLHRSGSSAYLLTQTKLANLAIDIGYSPDANPDAGLHNALFELVLKPADVVGIIDCETGAFMVYGRINPISGAIVSFLVTTPSGTRGATFTHALAGVDQSPHYVGPNTVYELSLGADDISGVTAYGLSPDPA